MREFFVFRVMPDQLSQAKRDARAHQIYEKITRHRDRWATASVFVLWGVAATLKRNFGFDLLPELRDFVLPPILWVTVVMLFQHGAKRAVRRAGWPHQMRVETEEVRRTATEFRGRHIEDKRANEPLINTFVGLAYFCAGAFLLAQDSETQSRLVAALCPLGIACCFVGVIWYLMTRVISTLRVDERGVLGYQFRVWPRLVRWRGIEKLLIERSYDPLRDAKHLKIRLLNNKGRALLMLALDAGWRGEQIASEIKGRLSGRATVDQTPSILPFPSD